MASNRIVLIELDDRLREAGTRVPPGAESFHRERAALLAEVEGARSWRGMLGLGQRAAGLLPQVDELTNRGQALRLLFDRIDRIDERLMAIVQTLERITDGTLQAPDCIPALVERIGAVLRRLGRQARTDDDLMVDQRHCEEAEAASVRLHEALALWLTAQDALAKVRASTRTAALTAALPELGERLCREGPTASWRAEFKGLVEPLEQLVRREQPREIKETEKIIKDLPRWARVLGADAEPCAALSTRFMAKRRDWPGEDDRTFLDLFDQARALERDLLDQAAAVRGDGITDLEGRYALFTELVGPDARIEEQLRDLRLEAPDNPRDFEDWCEQLRETKAAFHARVKRSETDLLDRFNQYLTDCRQRLEALRLIPRLDDRDDQLAGSQETFQSLSHAGQGVDALVLLADVQRMRVLRSTLDDLERAIRDDHAALEAARAALQRRAAWLTEVAARLGIALPVPDLDLGSEAGQPADSDSRRTSLEQERLRLDDQAGRLAEAEARFAGVCAEAIGADTRRIGQALAVLTPERVRADGLDLAPPPPVAPAALDARVDHLERVRAQCARVEVLLVAEAQERQATAASLQQALAAIPAECLGHNDRGERELMLRQLERQDPLRLSDPVERIAALVELSEHAEHLLKRFATAARRLAERRERLAERLRRFNGLSLQGYCPDLYLRVEALVHPPTGTRWPGHAQEWQIREAERLLALLEHQAQRLAAREIAGHLLVLRQDVRRTRDGLVQAVVDEVAALPPEQPPSARLRRQLAELAQPHLQ
ncbi:hypothetical protein [uncultured Lamprocystis sp.]|jgi:hypothetical protein|uniref:hypothetical protein n=1 Tax=uncultured Lamprocystis sp. TaxID=543132 RepID=UPI0025FDFC4C|nr:hypothetical protein [uncultured Lamprocystis sp.]